MQKNLRKPEEKGWRDWTATVLRVRRPWTAHSKDVTWVSWRSISRTPILVERITTCGSLYQDSLRCRVNLAHLHFPCSCQLCPFSSLSTAKIVSHVNAIHKGCRYCNFVTDAETSLSSHLRHVHQVSSALTALLNAVDGTWWSSCMYVLCVNTANVHRTT